MSYNYGAPLNSVNDLNRKQLPVFPGNSEMECMNMITTPISYWSKPNLQKGKYILRIGMDLPEVIYYYEYYDEKRHLRSLSAPYPIELANFAERWPRAVLVQQFSEDILAICRYKYVNGIH